MSELRRGSEKLLDRLGQPDLIPESALRSVIDIAREFDVEILDWCQYGQPGIDSMCGKFQVAPELAGTLIQRFLNIEGMACRLDVFPLGITDPLAINIDMTAGQMRR